MGLDMYLKRVPKVKSIEEINEMETKLSKAYYAKKLEAESTAILEKAEKFRKDAALRRNPDQSRESE